MKKLLTLIFTVLWVGYSNGQFTVTYTEDTTDFPNPERGFSTATNVNWAGILSHNELESYYQLHKPSSSESNFEVYSTIITRLYNLKNFVSKDIPKSYLYTIQADFDSLRGSGLKMVIRFAYS